MNSIDSVYHIYAPITASLHLFKPYNRVRLLYYTFIPTLSIAFESKIKPHEWTKKEPTRSSTNRFYVLLFIIIVIIDRNISNELHFYKNGFCSEQMLEA